MKKMLIIIVVFCFQNSLFAQMDKSEELKNLYESKEYDKIIKEYSQDKEQLSGMSLYYLGMAHYMKEEDEKCIQMMNLSIQKDNSHPDPYFIKAMTLNYLGKFHEAINSFEKAIEIYPDKSDYFSGLGDSYISINNYDKALLAYQESIEKENPIDRPFTMIPQIFAAQGKSTEALKAFYLAKENISKKGKSYITVLYNIGLLELLRDNYNNAEPAFKELIDLFPEDYHSYSKLIQIYYAKKEYSKVTLYKKKLYEAYNKGVLTDNLKEKFCFDQFEWKDKLIQAFERFEEEKKGENYYKYNFYVLNQKNEIEFEFRLQTENSPTSAELGGSKYLIGMYKDGEHSTFNYGFKENFKYEELKETIIEILEDKLKPIKTTITPNNFLIQLYEEFLNLKRDQSAEIDSSYIDISNKLALLFFDLGRYDEAIERFKENLEFTGKVYSTEHPNYIVSLYNLGRAYSENTNYKKALATLEEALKLNEEIHNRSHSLFRNILNKVSSIYIEMGMYNKALVYNEKTLENLDTLSSDFYSYIGNQGLIYLNLGQYDKSISLSENILSSIEKREGKLSLNYITNLNNLSLSYKKIGKFEKTLPLYKECLRLLELMKKKDHPYYHQILDNLANLYLEIGNYSEALTYRYEALKNLENTIGKENYHYAIALGNLAETVRRTNDLEAALRLLETSREILKKTLENNNPMIASINADLAVIYFELGDTTKANLLESQAIKIIRNNYGEQHPEYIRILFNLGRRSFKIREFETALLLIKKAVYLTQKTFGEKSYNAGEFFLQLAKIGEPLDSFSLSANCYIQYNQYLLERIKQTFGHFSEFEQLNLSRTIDLSSSQSFFKRHIDNKEILSQNFSLQLLIKGNRLVNRQDLIKAITQSKDSILVRKFENWYSAHSLISKQSSLPISERNSDLDSLKNYLNDLESELMRLSTPFKEARQIVTWQDIQQKLQPNEVAIEFAHFQYNDSKDWTDSTFYVAYVVRKDESHPQMVPLFEKKQLQKLLSTKTSFNNDFYRGEDGVVPVNKAAAIKQLVWSPLDSFLTDVKTIYYSPSGLLNRINLAAVPVDSTQNYSEKYDLHYVGSTRQLVFDKHTYSEQKDAIILGGIQYDSLAINSTSTVTEGYTINRSYNNIGWQYLQGTEKEAQTISDSLLQNNFQVTLKSKDKATEAFVKTIGKDKPSPKVLHIATHGFFFSKPKPEDYEDMDIAGRGFRLSQNPLIRSGLVLSGANKVWLNQEVAEEEEDNILTAYEIAQMNLRNTELVVLSACETGLGDIVDNEGVYGLQRAFKMAGAKNVIMSLWKVPDAETQELMTTFYSNWMQGQSIHDAFYGAQKIMQEKYMDEPYKWAGFVLME